MAKRVADRQLTDQNWEEEEDSEEPGVFVQAKEDVLKTREIKKAKRRGVAGQTGDTAGAGAFKSFGGFGASAGTAPSFSFGGSSAKPLGGLGAATDKPLGGTVSSSQKPLGGLGFSTAQSSSKPFSFGIAAQQSNGGDTKTVSAFGGQAASKPAEESVSNGTKEQNKSKYLSQLKSLNMGVSKWIQEHVDKNACCILTPIFKDYEKHLKEIEKLNPDAKPEGQVATPITSKKIEESSVPVTASGGFKPCIDPPAPSSASGTGPVFSLGSTTSSTGNSVFGGATGFSFKPSDKPAASTFSFATGGFKPAETKPAQEEEEYEPPKAEVTEVKEDDALYTKRCKLFYQKDGAWVERGVGNLHIKPCGDKKQLVMRADTSLGNILLNIMLNASIPLKRQGKNNVSMICIPNPPLDPKLDDSKPASMLIRVKTGEDADELLAELEKHKNE